MKNSLESSLEYIDIFYILIYIITMKRAEAKGERKMKVVDLAKKMGAVSNCTVEIREGFETLCKVKSFRELSNKELVRTINYFNIFDNILVVYVKQ